jgi:uncharacterized protein (UPF0335 family)
VQAKIGAPGDTAPQAPRSSHKATKEGVQAMTDAIGNNTQAQLKSIIERIENLVVEKKAIQDDIKDIFAEAKGNGFDVKVLREIVRMRKQDKTERESHEAIVETYMKSLGMLADLPLGKAAMVRDGIAA